MKKIASISAWCLLLALYSSARILYVQPGGNNGAATNWVSAKTTINAACMIAVSGDSIWVAKGKYVEICSLANGVRLFGGFKVGDATFASRDFKTNLSVIDGNKRGPVVTIRTNAKNGVRVDGFVIQNGYDMIGLAGGIYVSKNTAPTIANNSIINNRSQANAGGIACDSSTPVIINNKIIGNYGNYYGGGIGLYSQSVATIVNNVIAGNTAKNSGGGIVIRCTSTPADTSFILNNTIVANSSDSGGGISCNRFSKVKIANNIISFNSSGIQVRPNFNNSYIARYNCIYENKNIFNVVNNFQSGATASNTISTDPGLGNLSMGNFHIGTSSPCVNAGSNADTIKTARLVGQIDFDNEVRCAAGTVVDIGADEYNSATPAWVSSVVYVSSTGNDTVAGSSWATAVKTVQEGVNRATVLGGEIWVKAGTYTENIRIQPFAHLYGGFAGTENTRSARNWTSNATVLNGATGDSVAVVRGLVGLTYSGIDGFTIRGGVTKFGDPDGGGIYLQDASPTISNNKITANSASNGAGIFMSGSKSVISNNSIYQNASFSFGGAIHCADSTIATIQSNLIYKNTASYGAGISCKNSPAQCINNTIVSNTVTQQGGGIYLDYSAALISNNIVMLNSSGIYKLNGLVPTIVNTCVYKNTSFGIFGTTAGTGTIYIDPLFVDTTASNYHLTTLSPCVNTGRNSDITAGWLDIDGQARIYNNDTVDMGADESQYTKYLPAQLTTIFSINSNADTTTTPIVSLAMSGTCPGGTIDSLAFGNIPLSGGPISWVGWEAYKAQRIWGLEQGANGPRRVVTTFLTTGCNFIRDTAVIYYKYVPTIKINGGADTVTSPNVTVTLSATSPVGIDSMAFATSKDINGLPIWIGGGKYSTTLQVTLSAGAGVKYVYFQYRDSSRLLFRDSAKTFLVQSNSSLKSNYRFLPTTTRLAAIQRRAAGQGVDIVFDIAPSSKNSSANQDVYLAIYNLSGARVKELVNGGVEPGRYAVSWSGSSSGPRSIGSAMYICKLRIGSYQIARTLFYDK